MSNVSDVEVVFLQPMKEWKIKALAIYCDAHFVPLLINSDNSKIIDNGSLFYDHSSRNTIIIQSQ
jgi:hypothetical protein